MNAADDGQFEFLHFSDRPLQLRTTVTGERANLEVTVFEEDGLLRREYEYRNNGMGLPRELTLSSPSERVWLRARKDGQRVVQPAPQIQGPLQTATLDLSLKPLVLEPAGVLTMELVFDPPSLDGEWVLDPRYELALVHEESGMNLSPPIQLVPGMCVLSEDHRFSANALRIGSYRVDVLRDGQLWKAHRVLVDASCPHPNAQIRISKD